MYLISQTQHSFVYLPKTPNNFTIRCWLWQWPYSLFLTFCRSFPFLPDSRVTRNDALSSSYNAPLPSLNFLLILILIMDKHCIETQAEQSWQRVSSSDWERAIQSLWPPPFSDYPVIHWSKFKSSWGMAMAYWQKSILYFYSLDPSMILFRNDFKGRNLFFFLLLCTGFHPLSVKR